MNKNVACVLSFAAGAAIASVVTWKFAKNKYEQIAKEEIESVKEVFSRRKLDPIEPVKPEEKPDTTEYDKVLAETGYLGVTGSNPEEKGEPMGMSKPYVISPEEFDENGYNTVSLTYYADGVLTDFSDNVVENVEELIGPDALNHFGEYDYDPYSVYVRNDELALDIEILLDGRNFSDIEKSPPITAEV